MPTPMRAATPPEPGSLARVPSLLLAELRRADRGVVVLAVDGLPYATAAEAWPTAVMEPLTSTVPSTSTTGWLTALTGVGPAVHGVPGMVYRVPAHGELAYAVTGAPLASGPTDEDPHGLVVPVPTVFEQAGVRSVALGREIDHLGGDWAAALLAGAARVVARPTAELAAAAADPALLVDQVAAEVTATLAPPADGPTLVWVYVNLDDHLHRHGPDQQVLDAMRALGRYAEGWAAQGWTVVCHSDHGQVRCDPDPDLRAAWDDLDNVHCVLPAGGAGRIRWMYPKAGHEDRLATALAERLGEAALVLSADGLAEHGGWPMTPLLRGRIGSVVAIANSERFPIPDPTLRYEHGGLHPDELTVPFVTWRG